MWKRSIIASVAVLLGGLAFCLVGCGTKHAAPTSTKLGKIEKGAFPHAVFDRVLKKYNRGGFVDYKALGKDRADLDTFLAAIAKASPATNKGLFPSRQDELAYYINAYNALVFQNVMSRYPLTSLDGKLVQKSFFYDDDFQLGSRRVTLYDLENKIIRPTYKDARVHFALNCASFGCPRLPEEAFTPAKLEAQLDREARKFVMEPRNVTIKAAEGALTLSMIFNWYNADFVDAPRVKGQGDKEARLIAWINLYRAKDAKIAPKAPSGDAWKVRYRPYDWKTNDQALFPQPAVAPSK